MSTHRFPLSAQKVAKRLAGPVLLGVSSTVLTLSAGDFLYSDFSYQREAVLTGSVWQLVTANLTHLNVPHLVLNLAGLAAITVLHFSYYSPFRYIGLVLACCLGTTFGLLVLDPNIVGYFGLSGVLHGMIVWGVGQDILKGNATGWLLGIGVALKLIYEGVVGPSEMTEALIDAPVIYEAHLYGAVAGLLFLLPSVLASMRSEPSS